MLDYPVLTPENVRFHHTLAGPMTRLLAWLLDLLVVIGILGVVGMIFGVAAAVFGEYATAVYGIVAFVLSTGYWIVLEHRMEGRTLGKRALGLRVVGEKGLRLTLGQVVLRNLLRLVDLLPGPGAVGALFCLLHPEHRRVGDLVAGTLVVRERRVPPPEAIRGAVKLAQRGREVKLPRDLRRRVPPAERELLLDLCMRRDALDDGVRLQLFEQAAARYRDRLTLDQERELSDENLVLALTAKLFEG
jgi:uncharacterized RDD family membrane protein YckC